MGNKVRNALTTLSSLGIMYFATSCVNKQGEKVEAFVPKYQMTHLQNEGVDVDYDTGKRTPIVFQDEDVRGAITNALLGMDVFKGKNNGHDSDRMRKIYKMICKEFDILDDKDRKLLEDIDNNNYLLAVNEKGEIIVGSGVWKESPLEYKVTNSKVISIELGNELDDAKDPGTMNFLHMRDSINAENSAKQINPMK